MLSLGNPDDPHLLDNSIDAVLVPNTYHELDHPNVILKHLIKALKPGGRLVAVDYGPPSREGAARDAEAEHHEVAPNFVEADIRNGGFEVVRLEDRFAVQPEGGHIWWIIVARKPM